MSILGPLSARATATLKDGTTSKVKQCPYCDATEPRSGNQCGCGATVFTEPAKVVKTGQDYRQARLQGNIFNGKDLRNADFEGAHLQGSIFSGCDLRGANFRNANLQGAILNGSNTEGADFTGARMQGCIR